MALKTYKDPCSFSNPELFYIDHVSINWNVDFSKKVFKGYSLLHFKLNSQKQAAQTDSIILDTRDLLIENVIEDSTNAKLNFEIGQANIFGKPLKIFLSNLANVSSLKELKLKIEYSTSPNASGLQWLEPNTTLGKRHPYLFSQCQAIHARSILPCQDSPSIKFTYDAIVQVENPLTVLMSAVNTESNPIKDSNYIQYKFVQKIKIPSYLLAIAVGDLVSKNLGPISRVWTEKEMIDKVAYEFEQVDNMIKDAEKLLGEYVWGRYDILVLPPTFPYGGMENPCLTFVTPTLIAGDRSLVSVIQHEITHSWTGNLVTNSSWEHFWLNEGFTRFIENKLVGMFHNSELYRQFECLEGWRNLIETVNDLGETNQLTQLVVDLQNTDPDDAFSSIPYEKGHSFLFYLEELLGGVEIFNKYLRAHIEKFKGLSIDTDDWKTFLYEYFNDKKDLLDKVDWNSWLHKPGMPPVALKFDETLSNQIKKLADKLLNEAIIDVDASFSQFSSNQKRELLSILLTEKPLTIDKIESLNKFYKFGETQNSEILFRWLRLGLKSKWTPIIKPALKFVCDQGRMKFTRPIYKDLYAWEESRQEAIKNFQHQHQFMHQTTALLVAKDLHLNN